MSLHMILKASIDLEFLISAFISKHYNLQPVKTQPRMEITEIDH